MDYLTKTTVWKRHEQVRKNINLKFLRVFESKNIDGLAYTIVAISNDRPKNYSLEVKGQSDIYAVGDCTDIPTSKAGATAHYEAKIIAERIAAKVKGETAPKEYDGKVRCFFDAGFKRATTISFNFDHPPKPIPLSRHWYWGKMLVGKIYWRVVLKGYG